MNPSNWVRALGFPLVCLALFSLDGGHWAVLQSLAWGEMLWGYWQENVPVSVAMEKTFNGENPCALCTAVEKGRQKEKQAPLSVDAKKKVEIFLVRSFDHLPPRPPKDFSYPPSVDPIPIGRCDAPPTPVPRCLPA